VKRGRPLDDLRPGDLVVRRRWGTEKLNKLDEKWTGPFKVREAGTHGSYKIEDYFGKRNRS
jgi:hypothetical protein